MKANIRRGTIYLYFAIKSFYFIHQRLKLFFRSKVVLRIDFTLVRAFQPKFSSAYELL